MESQCELRIGNTVFPPPLGTSRTIWIFAFPSVGFSPLSLTNSLKIRPTTNFVLSQPVSTSQSQCGHGKLPSKTTLSNGPNGTCVNKLGMTALVPHLHTHKTASQMKGLSSEPTEPGK